MIASGDLAAIFQQRLVRMQFDAVRRRSFYRSISSLMRAGRSPSEALEIAWRIATNNGRNGRGSFAIILGHLCSSMRNGLDFGQALKPWIPADEHMRLTAFEGGEGLPTTLESLCGDIDKRHRLRRSAINALAYPLLLAMMAYSLTGYFSLAIAPSMDRLLPREEWTGASRLLDNVGGFAIDSAWWVSTMAAVLPLIFIIILPRWAGRSRMICDAAPGLALHARLSAIAFLQSMGSLMASGVAPAEGLLRLRKNANPYLRRRIDRTYRLMLNGAGFGSAFRQGTRNWPDRELGLAVELISGTPGFATELTRLADDWLALTHESFERQLVLCRAIAFVAVFGVVSGMILAMHGFQGQIAAAY